MEIHNFERIQQLESKNVNLYQQNTELKNTLYIKISEYKLLSKSLLITEEKLSNSSNYINEINKSYEEEQKQKEELTKNVLAFKNNEINLNENFILLDKENAELI